MIQHSIQRLRFLIEFIPNRLLEMSGEAFSVKHSPEKWSKKEILGHLIDSAANNHHRFIRAQFESPFTIESYQQNEWNQRNHYQELEREHVISFWKIYNQQLLEVIQRIPASQLAHICILNGSKQVTLAWLIGDYVEHLEHHLNQVTQLP